MFLRVNLWKTVYRSTGKSRIRRFQAGAGGKTEDLVDAAARRFQPTETRTMHKLLLPAILVFAALRVATAATCMSDDPVGRPEHATPEERVVLAACIAKSGRRNASTPDSLIRGCTRAIKSGRLGKAALAYAYLSRGYVHYANSRHDQALEDLDKAIDLKPDYPNAYLVRSFIHSARGSQRLADEDVAQYKNLGGDLSGC
jgi:tetratricopeptide (TPR) repeat protein